MTVIENEISQHSKGEPETATDSSGNRSLVPVSRAPGTIDTTVGRLETVGPVTNHSEPVDSPRETQANPQLNVPSDVGKDTSVLCEEPKEHPDDGGEILVEGYEDTVIY